MCKGSFADSDLAILNESPNFEAVNEIIAFEDLTEAEKIVFESLFHDNWSLKSTP